MILLYTTTVFPFLKKNCFNLKCLSASCGYILWWQMGLLHLTTHPQQDLLKRFWQSHCLFKKNGTTTIASRNPIKMTMLVWTENKSIFVKNMSKFLLFTMIKLQCFLSSNIHFSQQHNKSNNNLAIKNNSIRQQRAQKIKQWPCYRYE